MFSIKRYTHFLPSFFQTDLTKSKLTLTCLPGTFTYDNLPSVWPECVPFLNCTDPPLDPAVMSYNWTASAGSMPNVTVR